MSDNDSMLIEIARMYYEQRLSQKEIASQFGLSRPTLSRLIQKILDTGIVEIRIRPPEAKTRDAIELAERVSSKLKLKEVLVVPQSSNTEYQRNNMGKICAKWLSEKITKKVVLGLAGGRSVATMIDFIEKIPYHAEIVSLMGGINSINNNLHSDMVVWNVSRKIGAVSHIIHCPAVLANKNDAVNIKKNPVVSQVISLFDKIDLAIIGIGTLSTVDSLLLQSDLLNPEDLAFLEAGNYIGEICGRFFNKKGKELTGSLAERTVSITLKQLRKIPLICLITSGPEKVEGIRIAAKSGFFNVLITDEKTARALLELT
jgi:DNA-binding transcriptional regulator LsrR (DeoR family)